jgi:excinuclease ABC subunit C
MLDHIEKEMLAAAQSLDFEKAARLRDLLADLRATTEPATRFTRKALPATIDPARDLEELRDVLGLERAPAVMECFDISNITSTHIVASMVRFKNGIPERNAYRRYRIKGVKGQDDFASMAEVVRRRYSRVLMEGRRNAPNVAEFSQESPVEAMRRIEDSADASATEAAPVRLPDLIIVDGGRGQLSSACRELQRLRLSELPIIGLAKEFEEIYRPENPIPLRLPETSGALRMLQRIRDEAHRFANGFHSLLLKKRMSESLLDDVPGMTPHKKKLLLLHFGSVVAIKSKSVEQLAALPGISKKLAEAIHAHFRRRNAAHGTLKS